jgi:hypothetical protein
MLVALDAGPEHTLASDLDWSTISGLYLIVIDPRN